MTTTPQDIFSTVRERKWWIIIPTVFMTSMAVGYAILKPDYWDATQALFVRDEVVTTGAKLGSFESTDAMQTAQETILEVALHHNTLRKALEQVGPPKSWLPSPRNWPSDSTVEGFRQFVSVSAPNGAKFGRTEMIYLTVTSRGKSRAVELTDAVVDQLIDRLKKLRETKYAGIISELNKTIDVAKNERDDSLARMKQIEEALGSNISELRTLNNSAQGEGAVRRDLVAIKSELRTAKHQYERKIAVRKQMVEAQADPQLLIAIPNSVLDSHPGVRRLKEGLVDAQLTAARLSSELSTEHPRAQAAVGTVQKIKSQLYGELRIAVRTLDADVRTSEVLIADLLNQLNQAETTLAGLSDVRSEYASLEAEVHERIAFLEQARRDLSTARSNQIAASNVSLIQRVDDAVPGTRPIGPSGKSIVLAGFLGGLLSGLGLIYVFQGQQTEFGRRFTDNFVGRRFEDRAAAAAGAAGRRHSDQTSVPTSFPYWPKGRRSADTSGKAQPVPERAKSSRAAERRRRRNERQAEQATSQQNTTTPEASSDSAAAAQPQAASENKPAENPTASPATPNTVGAPVSQLPDNATRPGQQLPPPLPPGAHADA